ncbi:MAG: hypothetical protein K0V04_31570 [Deltaproteobacteria bacterium]|nr:hypothetical protein [Deltaproteobacteria bacterium]
MSKHHTFVSEHGGPGRRSRVDAEPRRYTAFERLVWPPESVERWPQSPRLPVDHIVVDPSGQHVVVCFQGSAVVLQPYGAHLHLAPEQGRWVALATDDGLVYGPTLHPWDGSPSQRLTSAALLLDDEPRLQLAMVLEGSRWCCAVASTPTWSAPMVRIESRTRGATPPTPAEAAPKGDLADDDHDDDDPGPSVETQWRAHLPGRGTAAVDDHGRMAVLTREGLHVFAADPNERAPGPSFRRDVAGTGYAVGAAAPGWVVLGARDHQPLVPTEHPRRAQLRPAMGLQQRWETVVQAWHPDGREAWQTTVPFEAHQPAIERPDGTVMIVGRGLAALADGAVQWHRPLGMAAAATAFGDGRLALVHGAQLQILDTAGRPEQTLEVPRHEAIVTQPTIAPDGTLYVGTATRVYAVR